MATHYHSLAPHPWEVDNSAALKEGADVAESVVFALEALSVDDADASMGTVLFPAARRPRA